jgi:hypothetical protein
MNNALKIILGLLTAWIVVFPLLTFLAYFGFIYSIILQASQSKYYEPAFPPLFLLIMIFVMCSAFLQVGLQGFYIVHNIVNKTGSDVLRAVLGLGIFFLPFIALPVYYFIYILPKTPPNWALAPAAGQSITPTQSPS